MSTAERPHLSTSDMMRQYTAGNVDFHGSTITGRLAGAYLNSCNFKEATFRDCEFSSVIFNCCQWRYAQADGLVIRQSTIKHNDFSGAEITNATFDECRLEDCDFVRSKLSHLTFDSSDIVLCDLGHTRAAHVYFRRTQLLNCNCEYCSLGNVAFVQTGFGEFARAAKLNFSAQCSVDWSSVCLSLKSQHLREFLFGSGMPDLFVEYMLECAHSLDPGRLFSLMRSTFISYGAPDVAFARRLQRALTESGVRTFFFETDSVPGERVHRFMHRGVNTNDRTILICSRSSLDRPGVLNELEEVFAREATEGGSSLLIPITLDDYVFSWEPARADLAMRLRQRVVADFRGAFEAEEQFHVALQRLLRSLRTDV